jgi:hypothetical protein
MLAIRGACPGTVVRSFTTFSPMAGAASEREKVPSAPTATAWLPAMRRAPRAVRPASRNWSFSMMVWAIGESRCSGGTATRTLTTPCSAEPVEPTTA